MRNSNNNNKKKEEYYQYRDVELHLPECPPNVEAHRIEPEECRQEEEMHADGCFLGRKERDKERMNEWMRIQN